MRRTQDAQNRRQTPSCILAGCANWRRFTLASRADHGADAIDRSMQREQRRGDLSRTRDTNMSIILSRLTGRRLSLADMADILERYVGTGADEARCKEACDALRRVRQDTPNLYVRTALRTLDEQIGACVRIRKIIAALRKWRHVSGA